MSARIHTLRHGLSASNKLWSCPSRVELVSAAVDTDLQGIGGSPYLGDFSSTGLRVPTAPTVDQQHRYLFRLCGAEIPTGAGLYVVGMRQAVTLRAEFQRTNEQGLITGVFPFEREVVSPWWRFTDGNVSFHLKWSQQVQSNRTILSAGVPGTSPSTFGVDSALLYNPGPGGIFPVVYDPPGAGIPPGRDVDWLGTIRELRYPWGSTSWDISVPCYGPGVVTLYASVFQTNPSTRIPPPQLTPPAPFTDPVVCGMRVEDQFLVQFPLCNYGRVAGALLLDLFPCCGEMENEK